MSSPTFLLTFLLVLATFHAARSATCTVQPYAATASSYTHESGGGAFNLGGAPSVSPNPFDAAGYACGDIVTIFHRIECGLTGLALGSYLRVNAHFDGIPVGGETGVAYSDLVNIEPNTGLVQNGGGLGSGIYGLDVGYFGLRDEVITLTDKHMTQPIFHDGSSLVIEYEVSAIGPGAIVIVRLDLRLSCDQTFSDLPHNAQGVVNHVIDDAQEVVTLGLFKGPRSVNFSPQTLVLENLKDTSGVLLCAFPEGTTLLTGKEFTAKATVTDPAMNGGSINADFSYSWKYGSFLIYNTASQAQELFKFDAECTVDHDGLYIYNSGVCPGGVCEELFLEYNQAQLFFDPATPYYIFPPAPTILGEDGLAVVYYQANPSYWAPQMVTGLYLNALTDAIVRAEFANGRVIDFFDVVYGDIPESVFDPPEGCKCRRTVDAVVLVDVGDVPAADLDSGVKPYLTAMLDGYDLTNSNFGVYEFDDSTVYQLADVEAGTSLASISAAIGRIGECTDTGACTGGEGDVAAAIDIAVGDHATSTAEKVIILVTNGYSTADTDVEAAVQRATDAGITILTVVHASNMFPDEIAPITGPEPRNPDKLVWFWRTADLANGDVLPLNGKVCPLDFKPCGDECCGYCDQACGSCRELDNCPSTGDCTNTFQLTADGCCALTPNSPYCPQPDNLGACEEVICLADSTKECQQVDCSYYDNDCYSYSCDVASTTCVRTFKPAESSCFVPTCDESTFTVVWSPKECAPDTMCTTWQCDEIFGCTSTDVPPPLPTEYPPCKTDPVCDPVLGYVYSDTECLSTPCSPSVCNPATGLCETTPLCQPAVANLCDLNSCENGICSEEVKFCPELTCQVSAGCNPLTGTCDYEPLDCNDGGCAVKTCDPLTGQCIVLDDTPCGICADDCGNNACQQTTCQDQVCLADTVTTDCSVADTCVLTGCDPILGCTQTPVVCETSLDPCVQFVQDPTAPGCCVEEAVNCVPENPDPCTIYTCHPLLGCVAEPKVCNQPA
eukprot:TRINITY_DN496_c0_g1_i1.p1 TRINITY_DN496_c0_g1~~TRINITY_DN496_c0_g1_i1.p1  ORF type:complete len:1039 (+),score=197.03 TRINITY_DN496_c0_g1_i1:91-3117(+)